MPPLVSVLAVALLPRQEKLLDCQGLSSQQGRNIDRLSAELQNFRDTYRERHVSPRYRGWAHLAFTFGMSTVLMALAVSALRPVAALEWLTVPLTFFYANLAEYLGHRGPMHHRTRGLGAVFQRHTKQHHRFFTHRDMAFDSSRDFKAVLFPPILILLFLVGAGGPVALLLGWLFSPNVALLFAITGLAYFLNYELLHFAYHCRDGSLLRRLPGINRLRELHLNHHNPRLMQRHNFNITYPIGDWLFGTRHRGDTADRARAEPAVQRPGAAGVKDPGKRTG